VVRFRVKKQIPRGNDSKKNKGKNKGKDKGKDKGGWGWLFPTLRTIRLCVEWGTHWLWWN
jgi:hypothetical protein